MNNHPLTVELSPGDFRSLERAMKSIRAALGNLLSLNSARQRRGQSHQGLQVPWSLLNDLVDAMRSYIVAVDSVGGGWHSSRLKSLEALVDVVKRHPDTCGGRVIASVLCSLYNGGRHQVDLNDLRLLDQVNFEHVLNVLRLDHTPIREVHEYFPDGSAFWEQMFADYGFDTEVTV